ncbi:hypothetical protein [Streptomyces sp. NBC_01615]|uniref:hypothetical protein n=1 Tax=Streptomyces sp. NBC_01615 TaxID=2975898 RepID=UPI0038646DAE
MRMRRGLRWLLWGMWSLCLAFAVVVGGWFAWSVITAEASGDPFRTHSAITCSQAMRFAHGTLPESARDGECSLDDWMDDVVRGTWKMPRTDVAAWLKDSYPDKKPSEACGQDVCLDINFHADYDADYARLTVAYEDEDTALVRLEAYSS